MNDEEMTEHYQHGTQEQSRLAAEIARDYPALITALSDPHTGTPLLTLRCTKGHDIRQVQLVGSPGQRLWLAAVGPRKPTGRGMDSLTDAGPIAPDDRDGAERVPDSGAQRLQLVCPEKGCTYQAVRLQTELVRLYARAQALGVDFTYAERPRRSAHR